MARLDAALVELQEPEAPAAPVRGDDGWVFPSKDTLALARQALEDFEPLHYSAESGWWRYEAGWWRQIFAEEVKRDVLLWLSRQRIRSTDENGFPGTRPMPSEPRDRDRVVDVLQSLCLLSKVPTQGWLTRMAAPEFLLCLDDGLFDPETGSVFQHTPDYWTTSALGFSSRQALEAPAPERWLVFLRESWGDREISLLQEWFGYCLTPDTSYQKFLFLVGKPGSGKGTIINVLLALVGRRNTISTGMSFFGAPHKPKDFGEKLLVVVPDARDIKYGEALSEILSLTGGDDVFVNPKNLQGFSVTPRCKVMLASNQLPSLQDASDALIRRCIPIQREPGQGHVEDHTLIDKLLPELPGIFRWAIEGLRRLRARGRFDMSQISTELRSELREATNPIAAFLAEAVVLDPAGTVRKMSLFRAWEKWAKENGIKLLYNSNKFSRAVRSTLSVEVARSGAGGAVAVYQGIRWRDIELEKAEWGEG